MFEFELASLGKLLVSILLGGLIGLERQIHGRPAGLRTHILVCMGATLVMIVGESFTGTVDPGRAVAGVVTGVGFLGAGVIVKSRDVVRGLTTAACIWFAATVGILVGQGLHVLAAVSAGLSVAMLALLTKVVRRLPSERYHTVIVLAQGSRSTVLEKRCREVLLPSGFRIVRLALMTSRKDLGSRLTFHLRTTHVVNAMDIVDRLSDLEDVTEVEWE